EESRMSANRTIKKMRGVGVVAAALLLLGTISTPVSAAGALGLVVFKRGTAYIYQSGKKRASLSVNTLVDAGDRIQTARNGQVTVQLKAGVMFRIGPGSDILVSNLTKQAVALRLSSGQVA